MSEFSYDVVEDEILDLLRSEVVQNVWEDYIPNTKIIERGENGEVIPYYVIQFGDVQPMPTKSMIGPTGDDHEMPLLLQAVSADPRIARKMANKAVRILLGKSFWWSGSIRQKAGFNQFTIDSSDSSVEAYASPVFMGVPLQFHFEE